MADDTTQEMPEQETLQQPEMATQPAAKASAASKAKEKKTVEKKAPLGGKIYTIPLRKAKGKPRPMRAKTGIRLVREFLLTHTKATDVKVGKHLNEAVWSRGKKRVPSRVRVHVFVDAGVAKAELVGHEYVSFAVKKKAERTKGLMEKMKKRMTPKEEQQLALDEKIEGKSQEKSGTKSEAKDEERSAENAPSEKPSAA